MDLQWVDSWDFARFEVPAHKWADLSEGGFGVALLNDCKYGYDIRDHVMRLSLIKSATMPDPGADQGRHEFTYALLPHDGARGPVRREARALNQPLTVLTGGADRAPFVASTAENIVIETLKPAEDGHGFILRLYEADRRRGPVTLRFAEPMARVERVDLLEDPADGAVSHTGRDVTIEIAPFEIVSLRCVPGSG